MLNPNRAGSALALTLGALYVLCLLLVVVWPQGYMAATAMLFHGFELSPTPPALTPWNFAGVFCIAIIGYLVGALYAFMWNTLSANRSAV
jgi:hypothetical protein